MADDDVAYRSFLLTLPCRCQPCVGPVVVHHNTFGEVHVGARPAKAIGGKRGKGQRASDLEGMPLCHRHHGQLHSLSGCFSGWTRAQLREWQNLQVTELRARYEATLDQNQPPTAAATTNSPDPKQPTARGRDWWTAGANDERTAIVRLARRTAAESRLTPDAAAVLLDLAELLEASAAPLAPKPTHVPRLEESHARSNVQD